MRRILLAVTVVLILALVVPESATSAMQRGGKGKGNKDTPLIIVFRDAPADLVGSDEPGAYIAGEEGIDRAVFDSGGQMRLNFSQPKKGKKATSVATRHLMIHLKDGARDETANLATDGPEAPCCDGLLGQLVSVFFIATADDGFSQGWPGGVQGLSPVGASTWLRFAIFGTTGSALEGWKLSYSDQRLRDDTIEGVGFATVTCMYTDGVDCVAWRIDKPMHTQKSGEENRAALVRRPGTEEGPDAGEWILPFAFAVCLRDAPTFDYVNNPAAAGGLCKGIVFPNQEDSIVLMSAAGATRAS